MIVSLCSAKGSPGVTTTAALLAHQWPRGGCTLIEADPSGGTLAARCAGESRISIEPGLISLAATRDHLDTATLHTHSQPIADKVRLVAAPPNPAQARAALVSLGDSASASLATIAQAIDVIIDCGRIEPASPTVPFLRRAEVLLVLARPRLDEVAVLSSSSGFLREIGVAVGLVCIGAKPYFPDEVATHVGLPLYGTIADNSVEAARALSSGSARTRRSAVLRSVGELAQRLASMASITPPEVAEATP